VPWVIHKAVKLKMCHKMTQTNCAREEYKPLLITSSAIKGAEIQQKEFMMPVCILGATGKLAGAVPWKR
jgi:hypothetical protein